MILFNEYNGTLVNRNSTYFIYNSTYRANSCTKSVSSLFCAACVFSSLTGALLSAESQGADVEDIADHERRVSRAEEQVVRSARTVYTLSQQVTQFQHSLGKLSHGHADQKKKVHFSQFSFRLFGTFEVFQAFYCFAYLEIASSLETQFALHWKTVPTSVNASTK